MGTGTCSWTWTSPLSIATRTSYPFSPRIFSSSLHFKNLQLQSAVRYSSWLSSSSMASVPVQFSASSTLGNQTVECNASNTVVVGETDLLIVGPGVLGRLIAELWRQEHPGCRVFGQTLTMDHHDELKQMGIIPFLKENKPAPYYPFIIFCAPPYRNADYPGTVRDAMLSWNGEGSFLFTSSSAPYDISDNGPCDEDSPVIPLGKNPRTDVLLQAEKEVLERSGCVVRLAGLYEFNRGPHTFWLKKGTVDSRPDHILNLIHYEDAASLCVAISKQKFRDRIFVGCDNHPLSRHEVMDIIARSGKFSEKFQGFTGTTDPLGKSLNNSKTREEVGWEPKYQSFAQFLDISE